MVIGAEAKRALIEPGHDQLSIARQCQIVGLARSTYYAQPGCAACEEDLQLMRLLDEQYLKTPFYGARKMAVELRKLGHQVGRKRARRLMRIMGLVALGPWPRTSKPAPGHKIFPYLLRDVKIEQVDQVWSTDITYIPMRRGFVYLVAVMDWKSRYVLSWQLSVTMDTGFCLEALEMALADGKPEIFNTDQGAQFTSQAFTGRLIEAEIRISMDGRGRALDNVFIERLWRSLKYEEIYLNGYDDVRELHRALVRYFRFYNEERTHQALGYKTPSEIYRGEGGGAGRMKPSPLPLHPLTPPKNLNQDPNPAPPINLYP